MDKKVVSKWNRLHLLVKVGERPPHLEDANWGGTGMAWKDWQRKGESEVEFLKRIEK